MKLQERTRVISFETIVAIAAFQKHKLGFAGNFHGNCQSLTTCMLLLRHVLETHGDR